MLLLGVLAAQAEAAAPAGLAAYDLLETEILTGSQASVTFSSLNSTYGADYQHLQIRVTARTDRSSALDFLNIRFNADDTLSNYARHLLVGDGSAVNSAASTGASTITNIGAIAGNTFTANGFGSHVIDILDPFETTKNTTVRSIGGLASTEVNFNSILYIDTAAITSIKLQTYNGPNFVTGSRFTLIGLK